LGLKSPEESGMEKVGDRDSVHAEKSSGSACAVGTETKTALAANSGRHDRRMRAGVEKCI
jgi:hypothetical protein